MRSLAESVPELVVRALREVNERELADLYDRDYVISLVASLGYREAASWLSLNHHLYFRALRESETTRTLVATF